MNTQLTIEAFSTLTTRAKLALLAAVLAAAALIWYVTPVLASLFSPTLRVAQENGAQSSADEWAKTLIAHRKALDDRSPFFPPVAPPRPVVKRTADPLPSGPAPRTAYGGPKLIGLVADQAVFDQPVNQSHQYLAIGQKGGGIELISIDLPWNANVKWMNYEYTLDLFDRIELGNTLPLVGGAQPLSNVFGNRGTSPNTGTSSSAGIAPSTNSSPAATVDFSADDNDDGGDFFIEN